MSEVRAFIALPLPDEVKAALMDARRGLEETYGRSVRWVELDNLHLTLKFLGDVPEERLASLGDVVMRAAMTTEPVALRLQRLGAFPTPARPRVFWAGLTGDVDRLRSLHATLEEGLDVPRDQRRFSPHITLGRARDGVSVNPLPGIELPPLGFIAEEVVLFRSDLRPGGPRYSPLVVSAIGGSA